jgi:hypothetical protein
MEEHIEKMREKMKRSSRGQNGDLESRARKGFAVSQVAKTKCSYSTVGASKAKQSKQPNDES